MTNVRIDSGVAEESIVSAHYDSMLAKIIAYGGHPRICAPAID